jgi:hypothetical protein
MLRKVREQRAWLATIAEELAAPLREMSYDDLATKYLNEVDAFDFTRDGVWIQAEVEAWLEDRKAGPRSRLLVSVQVSGGGGFSEISPVGPLFWIDSPETDENDASPGTH